MSFALFLNPRLTADQAIALHKMQMDSVVKMADTFKAHLDSIEDPVERKAYYDQMLPLIMQQLMLAMF